MNSLRVSHNHLLDITLPVRPMGSTIIATSGLFPALKSALTGSVTALVEVADYCPVTGIDCSTWVIICSLVVMAIETLLGERPGSLPTKA